MTTSLDRFLERIATRGSKYGGGSAAALTCALAAALLEKLASGPRERLRAKIVRAECLDLVDRDADAFSRVVKAYTRRDRSGAKQALKAAIDVPVEVYAASSLVLDLAGRARIHPQYRSDLQCLIALARASQTSAKAFVRANLRWLKQPAHARRIEARLAKLAG